MAFHSAVAGERPTAASLNDWIFRRVVADCLSSGRPASPVRGQPIYESDTDKLLLYLTSWLELGKVGPWTSYTPSWTATTTNPVLGNGTLTGRYQRLFDKIGIAYIGLVAGSTTTFGAGDWAFSLPSGWTSARAWHVATGNVLDLGAQNLPLSATAATSSVTPLALAVSGGNVAYQSVTGLVPMTWTTGDALDLTMIGELG